MLNVIAAARLIAVKMKNRVDFFALLLKIYAATKFPMMLEQEKKFQK